MQLAKVVQNTLNDFSQNKDAWYDNILGSLKEDQLSFLVWKDFYLF